MGNVPRGNTVSITESQWCVCPYKGPDDIQIAKMCTLLNGAVKTIYVAHTVEKVKLWLNTLSVTTGCVAFDVEEDNGIVMF